MGRGCFTSVYHAKVRLEECNSALAETHEQLRATSSRGVRGGLHILNSLTPSACHMSGSSDPDTEGAITRADLDLKACSTCEMSGLVCPDCSKKQRGCWLRKMIAKCRLREFLLRGTLACPPRLAHALQEADVPEDIEEIPELSEWRRVLEGHYDKSLLEGKNNEAFRNKILALHAASVGSGSWMQLMRVLGVT